MLNYYAGFCRCWSVYWDETCPNQPHLINKYQINMGFLYFHGIWILSVINILARYKINKYNIIRQVCSYDMLFIELRVCINNILLYELNIWTWFYSFLPRRPLCVHYTSGIARSLHQWYCAFTTPVVLCVHYTSGIVRSLHQWYFQRIVTYINTLEELKIVACYLEPSVCWNIFC